MWIIIPKDDQDCTSWGINHGEAGLSFSSGQQTNRATDIGMISEWLKNPPDLVVLNRPLLEESDELISGFPAKVRIWIHFGDTDLNRFTAKTIRDAWEIVVGGLGLASAGPCEVISISNGRNESTQWNNVLLDFKKRISALARKPDTRSLRPDELEKLNEAWQNAEGYYNEEQPLRVLLETFYPFYMDASNHVVSPLKKADWEAAKAAVLTAEEEMQKGLQQGSNLSLKRLLENHDDIRKMLDAIDSSPEQFIKGFKTLSANLTKLMGFPCGEPPAAQARRSNLAG